MYTGFKPNTSVSKTVVSGLSETHLQTLQRQVDNYTRKLEQQKKKYFAIQDTHKALSDEYEKQKSKLNQLKKQSTKAHNIIVQSKIKNLEANLQKAISTYDDTMSHNTKLKNEIDMLRRQKKNFIQSQKMVQEQIHKYENETAEKMKQIDKKKSKAEQLKRQIIDIKNKNDAQREQYVHQFDNLQKQYMQEKRERQAFKFQKSKKPQTIDTQPLLKFRLKNLMKTNKIKIKMIEQYKKQMKMIEQAFSQIKQKSGIEDLNEITDTFIKSEEQNYSLYNYMDSLSCNIDNLEKSNKQLEDNIRLEEQSQKERKRNLQSTPLEEKRKKQLEHYIAKKEQANKQLLTLIEQIGPGLRETLIELASSPLNDNSNKKQQYQLSLQINQRTIESCLSDLQKYLNNLLIFKQQAKPKVTSSIKQAVTAYTKPIPDFNVDEVKLFDKKQRNEKERGEKQKVEISIEGGQKFMDQSKFREYAMEYWERRKNKTKDY